jgi:hypothetical protein
MTATEMNTYYRCAAQVLNTQVMWGFLRKDEASTGNVVTTAEQR